MRLIDTETTKEALRNRISENIAECVNSVPTVQAVPLSELQAIINSGLYEDDKRKYKMICVLVSLYADKEFEHEQ